MAFQAKDEVRHLGASEGKKVIRRMIKRTDVQWLEVCPAL